VTESRPLHLEIDPLGEGPGLIVTIDPLPEAVTPEVLPDDTPEGTVESDLVAAMEPWLTPDLETYVRVIGLMFREIETYVLDEALDPFPGAPEPTFDPVGWEVMLDPDRAPAKALPYLAQFVGERLPVGLSENDARRWIRDAPNQRRGTVGSIVAAAKRRLIGDRLVTVVEREGGDPEALGVVTYLQETPSEADVRAELAKVVPIDLRLNYRVLQGQTWTNVNANYATWTAVNNEQSWGELAATQAGGVIVGGG
jgi:hypothetical protein